MGVDRDGDRLWALFERARDVPEAELEPWLDAHAAEPAQHAELAALVRAHRRTRTPLDRPAAVAVGAPGDEPAPESIGPYRVLRELGRGGMGVVYLCQREDGVHDEPLAVKLVAAAFADHLAGERFLRETRFLARLRHPGIARLLDGGTSASGRPYLVMDYVRGDVLDRHCADAGVAPRERVRLLRDVARAVAHAHGNLVAHLDLKPGNVIVRDDGQPVLLDFGIARLIGTQVDDGSVPEVLATPRYASPEQLRGETAGTASDVFSLGRMLSALVASPAQRDGIADTASCIAREAAPHARGGEGIADRDLAAIACRAQQPDAALRYPDARAFADELDRWLARRPVLARGGGAGYRATRFAQRNPAGVALAALAIVLLGLLSWRLWHEAETTRHALAESQRQRQRSERTVAFLADLFRSSDRSRRGGEDLRASQLLEEGSRRLDADGGLDPVLGARLKLALGEVHRNLGLYPEALRLLQQAEGADDAETRRRAQRVHGEVLHLQGAHREARALLADLKGQTDATADPLEAAAVDATLGRVQQALGELEAAQALYEQVFRVREVRLGPTHADSIDALFRLGSLDWSRGDFARAELRYREVLARRRATLASDHPDLAQSWDALGAVLQRRGRFDEALAAYEEGLAIRRRVLGPRHRELADSLSNLGALRYERGEPAQALRLLEEAIAMQRELQLPEDSPLPAKILNNVGLVLQALHRFDEAEVAYRDALAANRRAYGDTHGVMMGNWNNLGLLHLERGDGAAAREALAEALRIGEATLGPQHAALGYSLTNLGRAYAALEEPEAARHAFERALHVREAGLDPAHPALADTLRRYGAFLCGAGERKAGAVMLDRALAIPRTAAATLSEIEAERAACADG